jgi:cytochrome P450
MSPSSDLQEFVLKRPVNAPLDPAPVYATLREGSPITRVSLWEGRAQPWLVTRWEDARAVLESSSFTVNPDRGAPWSLSEGVVQGSRGFFSMHDDPVHSLLRRTLTRDFLVKRIEAMRPGIARKVDELLTAMTKLPRPVDFVKHLALPLPSLVICDLLGVPYENHEFFQQLAEVMMDVTRDGESLAEARRTLAGFMSEQMETKRDAPADDLLSRVAAKVDEGIITASEAADMCAFLLFAGHETTANQIALSTVALLQHPDQIPRMLGEPADVANAVEELLRYLTIAHIGVQRAAMEDVTIGGVTIRAGEGVIIAIHVANRDPRVFTDPDRLDLERANARRHLAFSHGIHQCLGQPLARAELQIALPEIFRRLPNLKIAVPMEEIAFKQNTKTYGIRELPVTW